MHSQNEYKLHPCEYKKKQHIGCITNIFATQRNKQQENFNYDLAFSL